MQKRIILSVFLLCTVFSMGYSLQTSSEPSNAFNQFMSPSAGVSMFSGDVTYSQPITAMPGARGMGFNVTLKS